MQIGEKINHLTLLEIYKKENDNTFYSYGVFECDCGNKRVDNIKISNVVRGHTKSCNCLSINKLIQRSRTHGMTKTKEYYAWRGAINRCHLITDDKYPAYGGRGIRVCDRWKNSFENFYADMDKSPNKSYHLGRIDHHKNYSKENCRWTTEEEEKIDYENGRIIIAWNESKPLLWWLEDKRCLSTIEIIKYRLWKLGWSTEKSIETKEYEG